jgi:hypothetical protein
MKSWRLRHLPSALYTGTQLRLQTGGVVLAKRSHA